MRRWCAVAGVAGLAVILVAAGFAVLVLRGGVSARAEPSRLETSATRTLRDALIPSAARERPNPVLQGARVLAEGREHFADHCAICHGNDGAGDTEVGRHLYPRAPDLRARATQELTDGELFYIIENGVRFTGMPAWTEHGDGGSTWRLVHFIRHLPRLEDEERREMEALNPRTAEEWRAMREVAPAEGEKREAPGGQGRAREHTHEHRR